MNTVELALAALLRQTGREHHQAFIATGGDDPDWPDWYADYLHVRLPMLLFVTWSRAEIAQRLVELDREQRLHAPTADWAGCYAERLLGDARAVRAPMDSIPVAEMDLPPGRAWKRAS